MQALHIGNAPAYLQKVKSIFKLIFQGRAGNLVNNVLFGNFNCSNWCALIK